MIGKNDRSYIGHRFEENEELNEGDTLVFDMPPFCSENYSAAIHIDTDGDPYIDKADDWFKGCRDYWIFREKRSK